MLKGGITAPEFSAHFFGPAGKLATQCATSADRKQMVLSEIYRWLQYQQGVLRAQEAEAFNQVVRRESISG